MHIWIGRSRRTRLKRCTSARPAMSTGMMATGARHQAREFNRACWELGRRSTLPFADRQGYQPGAYREYNAENRLLMDRISCPVEPEMKSAKSGQ
jgi:hypothetical protein